MNKMNFFWFEQMAAMKQTVNISKGSEYFPHPLYRQTIIQNNDNLLYSRSGGESLTGTLWEEGIFERKVAPLQEIMSFMWTGSGFTDLVTWIS